MMPKWSGEGSCLRAARRAALLMVRTMVAAGLCGAGASASAQETPRPPERIYATTCGYCHGAHVAPIIRGRKLPASYIAQMVRSGPLAMPAFRPTEITDAELRALSVWVSRSKADPKELAQ